MRTKFKSKLLKAVVGAFVSTTLVGCVTFGGQTNRSPLYRVKVEQGDSIDSIARRFRTTPAAIARQNRLASAGKSLQPGQELLVRPDYKVMSAKALPKKFMSSYTATAKAQLAWPATGWISSGYGMRWGRAHTGIDIAAPLGTPVHAAEGGRVTFAGWKKGYGRTVIVNHGNFNTLYAHMSKYVVRRGQWVNIGTQVGAIGRSGNARGVHLHFEYRDHENRPRDPIAFLPDRQLLSSLANFTGEASL